MRGFIRTLPTTLTFIGHFKKIKNYTYPSVKQIIRDELMNQTDNHCSYCDCKLRIPEYTPEIEHFIPRAKRISLETAWFNLFITCPKCNEKKRGYYPPIKPLKPDSIDFCFDNWFKINFETGELEPKPNISAKMKQRVEITIKWFDLNNEDRCFSRREELDNYKYSTRPNKNILDSSYPFFIERGI